MSIDLKNTLNLPQTQFPMRANSVQREPERIQHWEKSSLYKKIQAKNAKNAAFILHDGPPFTNGDVHIGTALNKILKDIILRYKSMCGYRTPYVPGWDCHGLPIEHKVTKSLADNNQSFEVKDLRKACAEFSESFIQKQRAQFQRLGVLADWENEYKTKNASYEETILRTFAKFVEKGLVYRSKKPIYWSIPCQTALAEAEVEYKNHVSDSIWVRFRVLENDILSNEKPTFFVIWTTTPWTIPANLAIAVSANLKYVEIELENETLIVAQDLAESFIQSCKISNPRFGKTYLGSNLKNIQTQHPFIDRKSPILLAEHVTTDAGTGCVHTAPGHGLEDYFLGLENGLDAYCPLDNNGCYIDDGQIPRELVGISVLDKKNDCPANTAVLDILKEKGALVASEKYSHSYPHCWRSKSPVIFRAMDQWFVSLDKELKADAIEAIEQTNWIPDWGENRIKGAIEARPDWCISRQRTWGVPIPAFYDEEGNALLDAKVIEGIAKKVGEKGSNFWFEASTEALLESIELPEAFVGKKLEKGSDTLDVWIDSGCSHRSVLQKNKDLQWPADLYLEGSDQHRGWFQSSLWTALIADGKAPYKSVMTHGFVVDENKKKISKSEGKPQTADSYTSKYGADILRLWIASEDYKNDIPISQDILQHIVTSYRTIRNTLKFQLGNLYDFDLEKNAVSLDEMTALDQWALHSTNILVKEVKEAYEDYAFHKVYQLINRFCSVTLSAIYHDILKDRLYTFAPDWKERRASQTAIHSIFDTLTRLLAPILVFTTDESFSYLRGNSDFLEDKSIHLEAFPEEKEDWNFPEAFKDIEQLLKIRSLVNEKLEGARQSKLLGQSLDAKVLIKGQDLKLLQTYLKDLSEFFIVSEVSLEETSGDLNIEVVHADGVRCPRSWRWVPELFECEGFGHVSQRCRDALMAKTLS